MSLSQLQAAIKHYRVGLALREAHAQDALRYAHAETVKLIQHMLDTLYRDMQAKLDAGETIPLSWLYEQNRLRATEQLIMNQIDHFGALTQMQVGQLQHYATQLGQSAAQALLQATVPVG